MNDKFLVAHGSYDTKIDHPDQEYDGIGWKEIAKLVIDPQCKPKLDASFIIPSSYRKHDGRSHQAQKERGKFHMLAVDIDDGNHELDHIIDAIKDITGSCAMIAYSSSSSSDWNKKWRVLIPTAQSMIGKTYNEFQTALFDLLEEKGIEADPVLSRYGQVIYLPNVPPELRDEDNQPFFYKHKTISDRPLSIGDDHPIFIRAVANEEREAELLAQVEREREARRKERERKLAENPDQVMPIDEFNARHSIEDLLVKYGYEQLRGSRQWRSPYQSTKSFATRNYETHWVSLSGSDASAGIGNKKGNDKAAYCWGDAFSLYAHFDHDGSIENAVRAYGQEINPSSSKKKDDNPFEALQKIAEEPIPEPQSEDSLLNTVFKPDQAQPILQSNYLIKGWLAKQQMSVVYGPSNVGKSFICLDMAWCIAANDMWQGFRVDGGPVLYLATEGGLTFHNRIYALTKRYGRSDVPLYVRPSPVDLLRPSQSLPELGKLCREIEADAGAPLQLIVVDTLSRAMAGGNENGPEDMTAFISNIDELRDFTKSHVMVVHHSGKDTAAGARGHSSLRAATDAEIELEKSKDTDIRFARATKQRDMETGAEFPFTLRVEELGIDQDGDKVTTVLIEKATEEDVKEAKKGKPSGNQKKLLEAFQQLKDEGEGMVNPSGAGWPAGGSYWIIEEDKLRKHFEGKLTVSNKRDAWARAINGLIDKSIMHKNDDKIGVISKSHKMEDK